MLLLAEIRYFILYLSFLLLSYHFRILPTDRRISSFSVLGPDGHLRPTDSGGNYLDLEGYPLPLDELGRPLDAEGILLPTDSHGYFLLHSTRPDQILASKIPQSSPLPTDELGEVSKGRIE